MSADEPTVALVFSPELWVEDLHRHLAHHGGARVRQVVVEPTVALDESYDVLVVSDRWPPLTAGLVAQLHDRGRRLLGVFDPHEPAGKDHLLLLEVDATIPADAGADEFVAALRELRVRAERRQETTVGASAINEQGNESGGSLVAVCGPRGSGVTEIALGVSVALAERRRRVALLDAHESAPGLAGRLGLPIEPNLCSAVDACSHGLGSLDACLLPVASLAGEGLDAVIGFPSAIAATQVTTHDVLGVVRSLQQRREFVVADLEERSSTAREVMEQASAVVAVMAADPVGVVRAIEWVLEELGRRTAVPIHLVVNRAPRSRYRQQEIRAEIERTIRMSSIGYCPHDRAVEGAAWNGAPVPRGGFRSACARLGAALDVAEADQPRRRARR